MSFRGLLYLAVLFPFASDLVAGSLEVMVKDEKGGPVSDAVVYASAEATGSPSKKRTVIDQRDKQFVPYVTALQELPLYSGVPAEPVVFDKVGFVTLGCNIHDWMIAYVAVLPTPFFQVTGSDGRAVLKDLPPGHYTVETWHPALKGQPEALAQNLDLGAGAKDLSFTLPLKADVRAKRAPGLTTGGYR